MMKRAALFVGVDEYEDGSIANLAYPVEDAYGLAAAFDTLLGFERVERMRNPAGKKDILRKVREVTSGLGKGDLFFFYFAGHGFRVKDNHVLVCAGDLYADLEDEYDGLPVGQLKKQARGPWDRMLVIDACQNDIRRTRGADEGMAGEDLTLILEDGDGEGGDAGEGAQVVVTSCAEGQKALEVRELGHGLFTSALLETVKEHAAEKRRLDMAGFREEMGARMGSLAKRYRLPGKQNPMFKVPGECGIVLLEGDGPARPGKGAAPVLEADRRCVQSEGIPGTVRFRFDPGPAGGAGKVRIALRNALTGEERACKPRRMDRAGEIRIQLGGQVRGVATWTVEVSWEAEGSRRQYVGETEIVVAGEGNAGKVARALGGVPGEDWKGLEGEEALAALRRWALGKERSWEAVELYEADGAGPDEPPAAARTERLALRRGGRRVYVFAGETLRFGREHPPEAPNDFTLRPGRGGVAAPYRRISSMHCRFAPDGDGVVLADGRPDGRGGGLRPSLNGTWWNGRRVEGRVRLRPGEEGEVAFGAPPSAFGVPRLKAKVLAAAGCAGCPEGGRGACGRAGRPSLLLERTDGVEERFLALWGCVDWGDVEAEGRGLAVFRKEGAFAWREGDRSGWLVPGEPGPEGLGGAEIGTEGNWRKTRRPGSPGGQDEA